MAFNPFEDTSPITTGFNPFNENIDEVGKVDQPQDSLGNAYLNPQGVKSDRLNAYSQAAQSGAIPANPSQPVTKETEGNGALGWFKDAIDSGAAGALAGQAHFMDANFGIGGDTAKYLDKVAERNKREKQYSAKDMIPFASDYWTNPQGAVYDVGNMVGSAGALGVEALGAAGLASMLPGGAVAGGAAAIASRFPTLARFASTPLGKLAVLNMASKPFEAMSEGGSIVPEMRKAGYSEDEIKSATRELAAYNALFLTATGLTESAGMGWLGKGVKNAGQQGLKEGAKTIAKRSAIGAAGGSLQNAFEERTQTALSNDVMGEPTGNWYNPFSWTQEEIDAAAVGGVGGAVLGGAGGALGGATSNRQANSVASGQSQDPYQAMAQSVAAKTGIPAELIYGQLYHESGGFNSQLARENNNFGGLTQVEFNGEDNKQPDGSNYYMKFDSPEKFADYYAKYLKKYAEDGILEAKTPEEYAAALKRGGYYTDSVENYTAGIKGGMSKYTGASGQVTARQPDTAIPEPPKVEFTPEETQQAVTWLEDQIPELQTSNIEESNYIEEELAKKNVGKLLNEYMIANGENPVPLGQHLFPEKFRQQTQSVEQQPAKPNAIITSTPIDTVSRAQAEDTANLMSSPAPGLVMKQTPLAIKQEIDVLRGAVNQRQNIGQQNSKQVPGLSQTVNPAQPQAVANDYINTMSGPVSNKPSNTERAADEARLNRITGQQESQRPSITLPNQSVPNPAGAQAVQQLQQQNMPAQPVVLPTAEVANLRRKLMRAVTSKDYESAVNLARQLGLDEKAALYENALAVQRGNQVPNSAASFSPEERRNLTQQLSRAATARDYPTALNLARQLGLEKQVGIYERAMEKQGIKFSQSRDTQQNPMKATKMSSAQPRAGATDPGVEYLRQQKDIKAVDDNIRRGQEAISTVITQKTDVIDAMNRPDLGSISFYWGEPGRGNKFKGGYGVSHIIARRMSEGEDGVAVVQRMVDVIAKGEVAKIQEAGQGSRALITHDGHTAVLSLYKEGNRHTWLLTGWKDRKEAPTVAGEVYDSRNATASRPTRFQPEREETSLASNIPNSSPSVNGKEYMTDTSGMTVPPKDPQDPQLATPGDDPVTSRDNSSLNGEKLKLSANNFAGQFRPFSFRQEPEYDVTYEIETKEDNKEKLRFIPEKNYTKEEQSISELGNFMGVPVRFFVARRELRGFYDPQNGISYINRNGNRGPDWAFWHENMHWMKQQNPALYRDLLAHIQGSDAITSEQIAQYRETIAHGETLTDAEVIEEMLSDEFADTAMRQQLLRNLQSRDVGLFDRLVEWLKATIARLKYFTHAGENSKLTEQQVMVFENAARKTLLSLKDAKGNRLFQDRTEFPYQKLPAAAMQVRSAELHQSFAKQLDDWSEGVKKGPPLAVGSTPDVLLQIGVKQLPIEISRKVVAKIVNPAGINGGKHGLSLETLKQLPEQLANPVLVFKSATVDNGIVVLTELVDSQGRSVIAAIHLEVQHGSHMVNALASVYGRNNVNNFVEDQIDKGRLLYADKEKSRDWLRSRGLQLPKEVAQQHDSINSIVPQSEKDVNDGQPDSSNEEKGRLSGRRYSAGKTEKRAVLTQQVEITKINPIFKGKDWKELRKKRNFPKEIKQQMLSKSPVVNKQTGWKIFITGDSFEHMLNSDKGGEVVKRQTVDHYELIPSVPELLERAVLVESHADTHGRSEIKRVHRFYAPADMNGDLLVVKLTALEYKDGSLWVDGLSETYKLYDHSIATKIPAGTSRTLHESKDSVISGPAAGIPTISVREMLGDVKNEAGLDTGKSQKGIKFSADIGEKALEKLSKQLGASPRVSVKPHDAGTSVGIVSRWLNSVAVIAKDHPKIKAFVHIAAKARERQEDLRQHFKHRADKWTKALKSDGNYEENKAAWNDLLWKGDALEKEFTTAELQEMGYAPRVIQAYKMVREAMRHAYKLANDVRQEVRTYSKNMSAAEVEKLRENKFVTILSEKKDGNQVLVSYKAPKIREQIATLTKAELEALKQDENVQVISEKPLTTTSHVLPGAQGLARGGDFFEVEYREQKPPVGNKTGYLPHFFHEWFIMEKAVDPETGKEFQRMLGSGKTMREAVKKANELAKGLVKGEIIVQPKQFQFPGAAEQAALVGDKDYFKMVQKVADDLSISLGDANNFLSDKVHMKNRHRFVGNFMKRTGAKGFEKDLDWVLGHYFNMIGRYVALDPFKHEAVSRFERVYGKYDGRHEGEASYIRNYIDDVLGVPTQIEKDVNSWLEKHPRLRARLGNYLGDRTALELAGNLTGLASALKLNFLNVASTMLQLTQFINLAGSINSYDYAFQGLKRAFRPAMQDKLILHRSGIQSSLGIDNAAGYSKAGVKRWIQYSTVSFRYADGLIRRASVLAAYQQALDQGKSQGEALQYAKEINQKANFEYAVDNAPDIFRRGGPVSQVMLQFQKFPIMQTEYMWDMFKHGSTGQKARFFVPYFFLAGIWGVPLIDLLGTLLGGLLGADWEKEMKKATFEWASQGMLPQESKALVKWLWYGGIPGVDIASRVGIGGFGTTRMPQDVREGLGRMFGVTGDTVYNAIRQISQGNSIEAVKAITPGVGNILQAVAGETKGKRGRTQTRYEEGMSRVIKALGFMPIEESVERDRDWIINTEKQRLRDKVAEAIDAYLAAEAAGNQKAKAKAGRELQRLRVTGKQLDDERQRKRKTSLERTEQNIPRKYRQEFLGIQQFQ